MGRRGPVQPDLPEHPALRGNRRSHRRSRPLTPASTTPGTPGPPERALLPRTPASTRPLASMRTAASTRRPSRFCRHRTCAKSLRVAMRIAMPNRSVPRQAMLPTSGTRTATPFPVKQDPCFLVNATGLFWVEVIGQNGCASTSTQLDFTLLAYSLRFRTHHRGGRRLH